MGDTADMRDAFFTELLSVARNDQRVVLLTADHGAQALVAFEREMPDRFYNVGIAEQNMISVAAGLASQGKRPIAYGISPFVSLRALEQITLDVAAMQLPVTVAGIGSGFAYSTDGLTHHGLQDVASLMTVPEMAILNSSDPASTRAFARQISTSSSPRYVRLEKGTRTSHLRTEENWESQGWGTIRNGTSGKLVITTGDISHTVANAADEVRKREGTQPSVVDVHRLAPLVDDGLFNMIAHSSAVLVIEEQYPSLGPAISFEVSKRNLGTSLDFMYAPFEYFHEGADRETMRSRAGLSEVAILDRLLKMVAEDLVPEPGTRQD